MTDEVIIERHGMVQLITINRPQARNAITLAVSNAVAAAVDELELLLTGDPSPAPRAAEGGWLTRAVPDGQAVDAALELAATIAENGPLALAATKQVARTTSDWGFDEGWEKQNVIIMPVFTSE